MYIRSLQLIYLTLVVTLYGCGNSSVSPMAELEEVVSGISSKAAGGASWQSATAGTTFVDGDALRTSTDGVARLKIGTEILRVGNDTTIYFGAKKIKFEGDIEIGVGGGNLGIDFGDATITSTGRLRIIRRDKSMRFVVLSGAATIERSKGIDTLNAGQDLVLTLDRGRLETLEPVLLDAGPLIAVTPSVDAGVTDEPEITLAIGARIKGPGVRVKTGDSGWSKLTNGQHELSVRTEIEIKRRSQLTLTRGQERVTLRGPAVAIVDPSSSNFVRIQRGKADAHAESKELTIVVPGGSIKLTHGAIPTNVGIMVDSKGTSADVQSGRIIVRSGDSDESVKLGESVRIQRGKIQVTNRAPSSSHITLAPQGRSNLHVLSLPTNVRVSFKKYCERAVVEVARGRSFRRTSQRRFGEGNAVLVLGRGKHDYQIRCYQNGVLQKKPVAKGTLNIQKDSGSRPLPKTAPSNRVDADGRRYTIVYQNRLPAITMAWKNAPVASSYKINVVANSGKRQSTTTNKPEKSFSPGHFREGDFEYWFSAAGRESKHSRLRISFDNAASTGYLSAPSANKKIDSDTVKVKGAAVLGWSVFVGAKRLNLDKQHRFDEQVSVNSDGLAVRFSHPKYGNHFYLRSRK